MMFSQDLELLQERQKTRLAVLKAMFDGTVAVGKDIRGGYFDANSLSPELSVRASDITLVLRYLEGEGLVNYFGSRGSATEDIFKLTHKGLTEWPDALEGIQAR